jgi:hypothetical protein
MTVHPKSPKSLSMVKYNKAAYDMPTAPPKNKNSLNKVTNIP